MFNWFKSSIGSSFHMVQDFNWFKESTDSELSEFNFLLFLPIKTKLASTANPELGTAQPQLVLFIIP